MIISETGGSDGIRDEGLLDSALNNPFSTFNNRDVYETIEEKATKLCCFLIKNHPFIDGNKRVGLLAMLLFLEINNVILKISIEEVVKIGYQIVDGRMSDKDLLALINLKKKNKKS